MKRKKKESLYDYLKRCGWKFEECGYIDLTPNPDVENFLKEKHASEERAKNCKMIFK